MQANVPVSVGGVSARLEYYIMAAVPLITEEMTVREITRRLPQAEPILLRFGIEPDRSGELDLRSAALQAGRPVPSLLGELREAAAAPGQYEEVRFDPETTSVEELTAQLERYAHPRIRAQLAAIDELMERASDPADSLGLRLSTLRVVLETLRTRLAEHFRVEEEVLFPLARQRARHRRGEGPAPDSLPGRAENDPFRQMQQEHEEVSASLRQIRELTDEYRVPTDAGEILEDLYGRLADLDEMLSRHIHIENDFLWPVRARQPRQR